MIRYYKIRMVKGGPRAPAMVWYGQPLDPITHEPMERSHRWCASVCGKPVDLERVVIQFNHDGSPAVVGDVIDRAEYEHMMRVMAWAEKAGAPEAQIYKPIDLSRIAPVF